MLATSRAEDQPSRNEADPRAGSTARRRAMSKSATKEGTTRYAQKFAGRAAKGHFREMQRLALYSLGIGTYLGQPDEKTDGGYAAGAVGAVERGMNGIDGGIHYRCQWGERRIRAGIRQGVAIGRH